MMQSPIHLPFPLELLIIGAVKGWVTTSLTAARELLRIRPLISRKGLGGG